MSKGFKIIKIPKDLTTRENRFYASMPKILNGKVDEKFWTQNIEKLNMIIEKEDSWKLINILRLLFPFFTVIYKSKYKDKIQKHIDEFNAQLSKHGVKILDLNAHSYIEMEICIYLE